MPRKIIEDSTEENIEEIIESEITESVETNNVAKEIKLEKEENSEKFQLKIKRVNVNGLYVTDINGNGLDIRIPKEYKIEDLKAGDIIYVSKSEL